MVEKVAFKGEGEAKAKEIVDWVESKLIHPKSALLGIVEAGNRTPKKILDSGKVFPALSCLDLAVAIGAVLRENGFKVYLVTERIHRDGLSIGLHFLVEVTDGKTRFSVDPRIMKTYFFSGWFGKERNGNVLDPSSTKSRVKFVKVHRAELPANAMTTKAFRLVGIKNKIHFLRLANIDLRGFSKVMLIKKLFMSNRRIGKLGLNPARIR
ncbi:MAG: hypothetical protein J4224_01005 [Candidatus Diapherotrites archaeon]|uniref:Uncharacterized protein n=1 Tax=Candidatus Iainarchaeum sp. TaxID=3101447 RepID=A0A8T4KXT2_9ARCH|nr:MAG: hypothetical protein QT03_C0001G0211 [archaeon GW2011_AR10]MBS3058987.1 hypothetical protein [Candidatus Diapherotrites archaeon]